MHDAKAEGDKQPEIDSRLEAVVDRMFDNCIEGGQFKQAIGIAIETRRMDVLEKAIRLTVSEIEFTLMTLFVTPKQFKNRSYFSPFDLFFHFKFGLYPLIAVYFQPNLSEVLSYCTNLCTRILQNKGLREDILRLLVRLHSSMNTGSSSVSSQPDYINICQCLIYLNDPVAVSDILLKLLKDNKVRRLNVAVEAT